MITHVKCINLLYIFIPNNIFLYSSRAIDKRIEFTINNMCFVFVTEDTFFNRKMLIFSTFKVVSSKKLYWVVI